VDVPECGDESVLGLPIQLIWDPYGDFHVLIIGLKVLYHIRRVANPDWQNELLPIQAIENNAPKKVLMFSINILRG
jgi:hypothetical protein